MGLPYLCLTKHRYMIRKPLLTTLLLLLAISLEAQPSLSQKTIDRIIQSMTLKEKAQMLVGAIDGTNYEGVPSATGDESQGQRVPGAAGQTNAVTRLGIPSTVVADGPAGLRMMPIRPGDSSTYYCTGFPVEILLASTWNKALIEDVGQAMGNDILEYGVDLILGPATNIMRNPLCGRNFEYFSEDPFLAGKMSAAMIRGIQSRGVGTSLKHFAANNQETNRLFNDARVSVRALREIYLKPFEIAVKESQPWSFMSSYNRINGVYAQESHDLLTRILRDDWGFKGFVMTDWTGLRNTPAQVHAGNDLMMPGKREQIDHIVEAVRSGELSEADVNRNVRRILEYIVKTPTFRGYQYSNHPDFEANATVSRRAAEEGIVLLKNENNTLPLQSACNIAFFGVHSYSFIHDGFGSGHVSTPYVVNMLQGMQDNGFTYNGKLKTFYDHLIAMKDAEFKFSPISGIPVLETIGIGAHLEDVSLEAYAYPAIAAESDMAIITLGRKPGEAFDRNVEGDFNLTEAEFSMIKDVCSAFHARGKKVIVILNVGGVVETASWKDLPDAIVLAWMPGQEGGHAVADVLTGKVNPSGHLPATFPLSYADVPGAANFPSTYGKDYSDGMNGLSAVLANKPGNPEEKNVGYTDYDEGIYVGYRYFQTYNVEVSYPFGYGLSYTTFAYENAAVTRKGNTYTASVTVRNTGSVPGKEVVQLYVSAPEGKLDKPAMELKAFGKTELLQPGETDVIRMQFTAEDLASFDEIVSAFVTDKGAYEARFCKDAESVVHSVPFTVPSTKSYPVSNVKITE